MSGKHPNTFRRLRLKKALHALPAIARLNGLSASPDVDEKGAAHGAFGSADHAPGAVRISASSAALRLSVRAMRRRRSCVRSSTADEWDQNLSLKSPRR
jgi:hypothetical protein